MTFWLTSFADTLGSGLHIDGVEVTQAIQYRSADQHLTDPQYRGPDNSIRLVADKAARVRVYVRTSPPRWSASLVPSRCSGCATACGLTPARSWQSGRPASRRNACRTMRLSVGPWPARLQPPIPAATHARALATEGAGECTRNEPDFRRDRGHRRITAADTVPRHPGALYGTGRQRQSDRFAAPSSPTFWPPQPRRYACILSHRRRTSALPARSPGVSHCSAPSSTASVRKAGTTSFSGWASRASSMATGAIPCTTECFLWEFPSAARRDAAEAGPMSARAPRGRHDNGP